MALPQKGVFRLWVFLSVVWILYVGWQSDLACPLELAGITTGAGPWCAFQNAEPFSYYVGLVAKMLVPPFVCASLILAIRWVFDGFREPVD